MSSQNQDSWTYYSISFNSAGPMMCYHSAENLVSALSEFGHDRAKNLAVQYCRLQNFTMLRLIAKQFRYNHYISVILKAM